MNNYNGNFNMTTPDRNWSEVHIKELNTVMTQRNCYKAWGIKNVGDLLARPANLKKKYLEYGGWDTLCQTMLVVEMKKLGFVNMNDKWTLTLTKEKEVT